MEEAGVKLIAAGANVYIGDLKSAESATNGFVDATEKGGSRVNTAGQVMIGALRQVGVIAVEAFGMAVRASADFIGDSIDLASDFEQTMSVLQATSDATGAEMTAVSKKAKELGSDLSLPATSAVDAGEAMLELSKSGFSVQESMDAAKGTLQLAAAAQIEEAKAAEISSNAINAFGLEAKDALFVSDLLAASANASSVEITDVAQSYQMAGAIFANFQGPVVGAKGSIVDLTTAVGILGNAGIKGSDAGTSLKQALLQLTGPSKKAKGLMQELAGSIGVAGDIAYDAQGRMRSFPEILDITARATKDLTDEKRNQYITDIFGADASRAILILMKQGPAAWAEMEKAVTRQGAAAELAAAKTQGYKGAIEGAKSQIETLQLTLAAGLLPVLADLINTYITPGIAKITDFVTPIAEATDPVLAFADAIGDWSEPLSTIAFYLTDLVRHGEDLGGWLAETPALFQTLVGVIQGVITEFGRLSDAFDVGGISGLISQLVADIGAALPDIQAALLGWGEALIEWIAPYIPPMLDALGDAVDTTWGWVQDQAPKWIDQLMVWGEALIEWVKPYIPPMLDALGDLVGEAWDWIKGEAPKWGKELLAWGNELVEWIEPMIPPAIDALGKLGGEFLDWIGDQAAPLLDKFNDWATSFVEWIPGATVKFLAEWPKMFDDFLDWIGDQAGPLLLKLGDWALSFTSWIVPMIPGFVATLAGVTVAILAFVAETALTLGSKIVTEWVPALINWIDKEAIPRLGPALSAFWGNLKDLVWDVSMKIGQAALDIGISLIDGIKEGVSNAWGSFTSWLLGKASSIIDDFLAGWGAESPAKEWMPAGVFAVQGIMAGFSEMWPSLTKLVEGLGEDLVDQAAELGRSVQSAIASSFGATASIDRQIASNLDRFEDVPDQYRQFTEGALRDAEHAARQFLDPAEGAQFFKMRSDQILEFAKLQKDLAETQDSEERRRIQTRMNLINAAQTAEISAFNANLGAGLSGTESLMADLQSLLAAKGKNAKGEDVGLPGILENEAIAAFTNWLQQLTNYAPNPYRNPMMSSAPVNNNQRTYNMPVYTNNSPEALQQSAALMGAMYP